MRVMDRELQMFMVMNCYCQKVSVYVEKGGGGCWGDDRWGMEQGLFILVENRSFFVVMVDEIWLILLWVMVKFLEMIRLKVKSYVGGLLVVVGVRERGLGMYLGGYDGVFGQFYFGVM